MTSTVPVDPARARHAVRAAGQIGPYFIVGVGARDGFVAAQEFYDPARLRDLLDLVAQRIGTDEPRVAASSLQYELAERLWAIALACWQLDRLVVRLDTMTCQGAPNGRIRLRLTDPVAVEPVSADPSRTAALIADHVTEHLVVAHTGLRALTRVADALLWGNAATAIALVTRTLFSRNGDESLVALSTAMLASPPLAGRLRGSLTGNILRRTCCLYYRTSARRTCGDCPLTGSAVARSWA